MITDETARQRGAKFFKEQGYPKLAKMVEHQVCLDRLFEAAAESLGKKKLKQLYLALPKSLRTYFLHFLNGYNELRLQKAINQIWDKLYDSYTSDRPERRKNFQEFMKEMDEALQRYFER